MHSSLQLCEYCLPWYLTFYSVLLWFLLIQLQCSPTTMLTSIIEINSVLITVLFCPHSSHTLNNYKTLNQQHTQRSHSLLPRTTVLFLAVSKISRGFPCLCWYRSPYSIHFLCLKNIYAHLPHTCLLLKLLCPKLDLEHSIMLFYNPIASYFHLPIFKNCLPHLN